MSAWVWRFVSTLRGGRLLLVVVLALGLLLALGRAFAAAYIEILWQIEAGYAPVFWRRVLWEWGVRVAAGLVVGALVFANLAIAARTLSGIQIRRRFGNIEIAERVPRQLVSWGVAIAAALLGLWFGAAVPANLGIQALLLVNAQPWGVVEPVLGHDVGFYVFWLPVLGSLVTLGLIVTFLVFTLVTAAYAATGTLRWVRGRLDAQELPRLHLAASVAAFLLLLGARLWLQRYFLVLDGNSPVQGIFGYTDAEARLPGLRTLAAICVAAALGTLWGAWRARLAPFVASVVAVAAGSLLIGQLYPSLVQRVRVEPNELERETPFIEHNLSFTRLGFGLDGLERRRFEYDPNQAFDWTIAARQFEGLPVWSRNTLLTTYRQLEALFPYYEFSDVTIDRYRSPDGLELVALSVREVDQAGIQEPSWQNQHLRKVYVVGAGAVAGRASVATPEGRPEMLIRGIPAEIPEGVPRLDGLRLERPDVFFGTRQQPYAVVGPGADRYFSPDGSPGVAGVDFPRGIELASSVRTALIAWHFGDWNLLFASELTDSSRFVYRRRAVDRALAIAPFLRFPEDPYAVLADGRIHWVLEGFTGTGAFPLSSAYEFGTVRNSVRYVRNSVKVTVDAVTGEVRFYRVPVADPLVDAYARAFPELFRPLEEMPPALREHLRYSRALLDLQSRVLLRYHQESAPAFHGQQDVWAEAQELAEGTTPVPYRPEYGIYTLPGEREARFQLTTLFVPAGRQNLTGILVGRTTEQGATELILFDVPVADQVPGPRQIEALVEQDPEISQQFSLWRTGGSEVWTGNLHFVPVGKRFLYMEAIFLAAEADAIPELRRFVVSDGRRVAMTEDLQGALAELAGLDLPGREGAAEAGAGARPSAGAARWPRAALDLLDRAEGRARDGDWQGFGAALAELRALLQRLQGEGPPRGDP